MGSIVHGDTRPHAVAIPFPSQGHISPLFHLCKALASKGFVITFININSNQERMKNNFHIEDGLDIRFETIPDLLPVPVAEFDIFYKDNRVLFFNMIQGMEAPVEKLLVDKIGKNGPPVSCLISDLFFKWPREVAGRLGLPNVIFWTATASSLMLDYNIPTLLEQRIIPFEDPSSEDVITCLPSGLSPLPTWALPSVYSVRDATFDPGFVRRYSRTRNIANDAWILTNSFEEIERDVFEATRAVNPNSLAVGPLLLYEHNNNKASSNPSLWKEDDKCLAWLDKQQPESVLYVSFGSLATISFEQFLEIAAGLEELQRPFLWAIRPNSVLEMKREVFEEFKNRVSEAGFGMVTSWAPQLQILMHPSAGGFLTHCGWNSTLESICAGVPVLCWPCVAEQNLNCKLIVQDWKIGLKFSKVVSREVVNKDEFVEVVRKLMADDNLRRNVKKLKEEAYKTVSEGGSSFNNLQTFVDAMAK